MRIATAIDDVNRGQVGRLVGTLEDVMERPVEGARIGVLGLAFKPDTDDTRESPALELADQLHARGVTVVACDPEAAAKAQASRPWLQIAADPLEVGRDADAVILATEWPAFVTMDLDILASSMRGRVLVDGRNALDPAKAAAAGLRYVGVGRRADA
jgi:UDPglucose 6-dehydrogenase